MNQVEWVALSILPGVGGVTMRRLLAHFGSISAILAASESQLCAVYGVGTQIAGAIRHASVESTHTLLAALADEGINPITWQDPHFPANLLTCADAPPLLFARGSLTLADDVAVAIVGSRKASADALDAATLLASELSQRGVTIVSGLAIGIDTAAHQAALDAGGRTLAVLGSGLHAIHPRRNRQIAEQVTQQGALLSELHPDAGPTPTQLVARDRIVSGLSRRIIVVESDVEGGSMRTAEFARRQRRVLAAMPGSPGTDMLIAGGAETIALDRTDWDALADAIRKTPVQNPPASEAGPPQARLMEIGATYLGEQVTSETSHRQSCRSDSVRE